MLDALKSRTPIIAGALAGSLFGLVSTAGAQTVLQASVWTPMTHVFVTGLVEPWAEDVERVTEGRVTVEILPKAVATPPGAFDAVRDGLADVTFGVHGYTPGRFVASQMVELPFLGDSVEAMSVAYQRIYERHFAELPENQGVKTLGVFTHGPGTIFNTQKTVDRIEDLDGMSFRTNGGLAADVTEAIGATPLLKAAPESYELLSSGVADGVLLAPDGLVGFGLQDVVEYTTLVPGGLYNTSFFFVMNQDAFDGLDEADRQAIEEISGEHAVRRLGQAQDRTDERALEIARENGIEIVTADEEFVAAIEERVADIEAAWVESASEATGLDAGAILEEFRAEIENVRAGN